MPTVHVFIVLMPQTSIYKFRPRVRSICMMGLSRNIFCTYDSFLLSLCRSLDKFRSASIVLGLEFHLDNLQFIKILCSAHIHSVEISSQS